MKNDLFLFFYTSINSEMQNEAITTEHQESNDLQLESSSNNTQDTDNISESSQRSIPELEYLSSKSDDSNFTTLSTLSDTDRSIVYIDIEVTFIDSLKAILIIISRCLCIPVK